MTMTAFELRRHLDRDHHVSLRGLRYSELVAIHEDDHRIGQEHDHEEGSDGH